MESYPDIGAATPQHTLHVIRQCVDALRGWMDQPDTKQALDSAQDRAAQAAQAAAAVLCVARASGCNGPAAGIPRDQVEALRRCATALDGWLDDITSTEAYDVAFRQVLVAIDDAERVLAGAEAVPT
jgi:hypothetical protein